MMKTVTNLIKALGIYPDAASAYCGLIPEQSFRNGIKGFLDPRPTLAELVTAIETVRRYGVYLPKKVISQFVALLRDSVSSVQ